MGDHANSGLGRILDSAPMTSHDVVGCGNTQCPLFWFLALPRTGITHTRHHNDKPPTIPHPLHPPTSETQTSPGSSRL
jgi:hypothetical protein